jgi:hypothetical protein
MEIRQRPIFTKIKYWVDCYGNSGADDKRAIEDFVDCEANEAVSSLRSELVGLSQGLFDEAILNLLIGASRKEKFGSFNAWAKMMLLWLSAYKS